MKAKDKSQWLKRKNIFIKTLKLTIQYNADFIDTPQRGFSVTMVKLITGDQRWYQVLLWGEQD